VLLPRFVDISKKALSPTGGKRRGEPRRCGRPQSHLKNANRPASMLPSSARQRVLKNSSRSAAPFYVYVRYESRLTSVRILLSLSPPISPIRALALRNQTVLL
jgi:hypothetical protein